VKLIQPCNSHLITICHAGRHFHRPGRQHHAAGCAHARRLLPHPQRDHPAGAAAAPARGEQPVAALQDVCKLSKNLADAALSWRSRVQSRQADGTSRLPVLLHVVHHLNIVRVPADIRCTTCSTMSCCCQKAKSTSMGLGRMCVTRVQTAPRTCAKHTLPKHDAVDSHPLPPSTKTC